MQKEKVIVIVGGGAAGYFAALSAKEHAPKSRVVLLEKSRAPLSKVRISGGGRCNVTHACYSPKDLVAHYPRGSKELLGPFHTWGPRETIAWFAKRGVELKTEADGRMFPVTDSSQTIIDCLTAEIKKLGVEMWIGEGAASIEKRDERFAIACQSGQTLEADAVILTTGSSSKGWKIAEALGHTIVPPVPSLFTLNVPTSPLLELAGVSVDPVEIWLDKGKKQRGPLLLTHWGFSGPSVLRLSAWEARTLQQVQYRATVHINWVPDANMSERLLAMKSDQPQAILDRSCPLPKQLWRKLLQHWEAPSDVPIGRVPDRVLRGLAERCHKDSYTIEGKTTYKQEFVTCGGISLKDVHFPSMESKLMPGLFFAGEVLDIDGITGGFNFQNAWTTGWLAGRNC